MRSRRELRQGADIWPGFVDALSTLLLVIIFLLVVFVLGQFFLTQLLQGKDSKLLSLEQAIADLTDQLDLEQASNAELRRTVTTLTADLQAANAAGDDVGAELAELRAERDEYRDRLVTLEEDKTLLAQTMAELRDGADRAETLETDLARADELRAELEAELERAQETIATDRETLEARLAELVQIRRDIEALTEVRQTLEQDVAEMTALLRAANEARDQAESRIAALTGELEESEAARSENVLRVDELTAALETARAERSQATEELQTALSGAENDLEQRNRRIAELAAEIERVRGERDRATVDREELEKAREALLVELGQARDRASELEARLASEQKRTTLAQRELEERGVRIAELLRSVTRANETVSAEQQLSQEALAQVDTLNRQINALRVQLSAIEQALEVERKKVDEQRVTIADLGSKLNLALAGKVEELSRFRSEFFGRLRQILGSRPGIRVVGDRFVFQSEILFPSGSADLEQRGEEELRRLAESLRQISGEIPSDLPWVLQINGHTDRQTIRTTDFPSNWELSAARAINVGKSLIRYGIPPERIAVAGFAQFQPIDDRSDEIAFRRNRRIEIKLTTR
jgi:chemotaxis protein MotB